MKKKLMFVFSTLALVLSNAVCVFAEELSLGEKMKTAGLNTLMGMGTVFIMLILMSLIISCFSIVPKIEAKRAEKAKKLAALNAPLEDEVVKKVVATEAQVTKNETEDLELVAVIAAAIAAATGQSTDGFVVRSIKRR